MTQVNNPLAIKTYSSNKYNLTWSILNESDDISWRFYKMYCMTYADGTEYMNL